mmetsp:Transcript_22656/g.70356  ORF Transcript_22656/g.70356 Transcript_22656/m.70356 type:complete len:117 (+) Transcript_22656:174-524(+)
MLRKRCVAFMELNSGDFEPFVEDDEGWGTYIARMAKDGEWAGNMEVQAASKVLGMNICIHQADKPRWEVHNFEGRRCIHLSYEVGRVEPLTLNTASRGGGAYTSATRARSTTTASA